MIARVTAALLLALAALLMAAGPASADVSGPCTLVINGQDIAELSSSSGADAFPATEGAVLNFTFFAQGTITTWDVTVHYGPASYTFLNGTGDEDDPYVEGSLPAGDLLGGFDWLAVGLYRVTVDVTLEQRPPCEAAFLLKVEGDPLSSVMGVTAAGVTSVGVLGVGASAVSGWKAAMAAAGMV